MSVNFLLRFKEMGYDVKNKIAIVTGSAKGFGKEFVIRLLKKGAKVCISDVNEQEAQQTTNELETNYGPENVTSHRYIVI